MVCLVEAQGEVVCAGALVQDGTVGEQAGEHADVHPHLHREVAVEEYGVHRLRLKERRYRQRYVVVYGLLVQFGGDDDVVRVDIARHDVLVELDSQLVAVAQNAVGGRRCVEVTGTCHVLGDGNDVAIHLNILVAVGSSGEGAELIRALRIGEVAQHLHSIWNVARGRHQAEGSASRIGLICHPSVKVNPLRVTLEAVLHAYVLQVLELAVEAFHLHLQLGTVRAAVQHRFTDSQFDGRRRGFEMYAQLGDVVNLDGLVGRREPEFNVLVVEHTLVGLTHSNHLLHCLAGRDVDAATAGWHAVHQYLQSLLVGTFRYR